MKMSCANLVLYLTTGTLQHLREDYDEDGM